MQEMALSESPKAYIQEIHDVLLEKASIKLFILREDQLRPTISGNKWRKLKYNLIEAKKQDHDCLLTFGGAYSNHIHATAAAGKEFGFKTIGLIRGEEYLPLNPTLQDAKDWGMKLHYVSREDYKKKDQTEFTEVLRSKFGRFYLLPEGGTNKLALLGCAEMVKVVETTFDYWCVACGTGGTLAGVVQGVEDKTHVIGFSALKNGGFLKENVDNLLGQNGPENHIDWEINVDNHFGGYAKYTSELIDFINQFKKQQGIQLDPIYTGKMMYGLFNLAARGFFSKGSRILAVHTGGKQGIAGFNQRNGNIID